MVIHQHPRVSDKGIRLGIEGVMNINRDNGNWSLAEAYLVVVKVFLYIALSRFFGVVRSRGNSAVKRLEICFIFAEQCRGDFNLFQIHKK